MILFLYLKVRIELSNIANIKNYIYLIVNILIEI